MTVIRAEDKFLTQAAYTPFAQYDGSSILRPVVSRPLNGLGNNDIKLPVDGFVGHYTHDEKMKPVHLGVVSDTYELLQMRELTTDAEAAMFAHFGGDPEILDTVKVTDRSARKGAWVRRSYQVDAFAERIDYREAGIKTGTKVAAKFDITTGFDGQTKTVLTCGLLDLVCDNGMVRMTDGDSVSRKHVKGTTADFFRTWMTDGMLKFADGIAEIRAMADSLVDPRAVDDVIKALPGMSERKAARMIERVETEMQDRGRHAYAVLSAFTYYSSHDDVWFPVKKTGNDNVEDTLAARQAEVTKWVGSDAFKSLLAA